MKLTPDYDAEEFRTWDEGATCFLVGILRQVANRCDSDADYEQESYSRQQTANLSK